VSHVIAYATDNASLDDLLVHLHEVDADFVPALSSRIDIADYAGKLKRNARLCEAWYDGVLVGLVAGYCNDQDSKTGFITSVSVLRRCMRQGIGEQLVNQFLGLAREAGMMRVCLEVSRSRRPAVRLYRKLGFHEQGGQGYTELMSIDLSEKTK
jgi:ribosomal protein S18 acetylase RimI-like enzyme